MVNKNLALVILVILASGCGTEFKTYVMTKPRVGLDEAGGNGGCVVGKCLPAPGPAETTRKVYVLEITRPVPESEVQKIERKAVEAITEQSTDQPPASESTEPEAVPADTSSAATADSGPQVPVVGELPGQNPSESADAGQAVPAAAANGGSVQQTTYTVQKDDTLQKISKKVYGSYGKWYKIYEANKSKIKNPNILRSGTVLTIPSLK
jgi:nucleoid-associated protein YgaU